MSPTRSAEPSVARCAFCGKPGDEVQRLIAGPAVYICNECVGLCEQILANEDVPSFPDLDAKSDEDVLAAMARLDASRHQLERSVAEHVHTLRKRKTSWSRIGDAFGISRQSAWERFSENNDAPPAG